MKRYWKQTESIASRWTTEQDCFLIENNSLSALLQIVGGDKLIIPFC